MVTEVVMLVTVMMITTPLVLIFITEIHNQWHSSPINTCLTSVSFFHVTLGNETKIALLLSPGSYSLYTFYISPVTARNCAFEKLQWGSVKVLDVLIFLLQIIFLMTALMLKTLTKLTLMMMV